METRRPDPDALLRRISRAEEREKSAGRLKIFFGYAAGVGKTYAMLAAARALRASDVDVAAGYVEPHARPETLALLDGLEQIPPREITHRGIALKEFDVDAALARHPQILLVDELAHTNAEGSRNRKRYQDIEELLKAGISVWTTVNVQHIESLNDIVASITGIPVRERVPDRVFDRADQVELVDIEPEDLIERLRRGMIYREAQAGRALDNFFIPENLIALREIALRRTADRVNRQAEQEREPGSGRTGRVAEHVLICLSSSPSNAKVIRTAARLADAFHGAFTALFVSPADAVAQSEADRRRLAGNIRLAEQLGARIVTVYGNDVPAQIAEYARAAAITKIVIGRSNTRTRLFSPRKTLVERLAELAPDLDIHIIPDQRTAFSGRPDERRPRRPDRRGGVDWAKTAGVLCLSSLAGVGFELAGFSGANIITMYILGVLAVALWTDGFIYGAAASLFGVLSYNFLFTEPRFSLNAYGEEYPVTFLVMFLASFLLSGLMSRARGQAREAARRAYRTEVLLESSQKLQRAENAQQIMAETAGRLERLLHCAVLFYPARGGELREPLFFPHSGDALTGEALLIPAERAVAQWVLRNNKRAGAGTDTLPGARCLYLAVRDSDTVLAVVGLALDARSLDPLARNMVTALLGECALALEKERLNRLNNRNAVRAQREQLRANLLRAISHDLRTPLTGICGNAGVLMANGAVLDADKKQRLYTDIYDDALWLINLVENLLSVTRLENGGMALHKEPELLEEVISEALRHLSRRSAEHVITTSLEDDLLMAFMDSRLIMQVIINIVDNAVKYTPVCSRIAITAARRPAGPEDGRGGDLIQVDIADDGDGIADEDKARLFDMFYTADSKGDGRRGLGLGLSLCRSIVQAHGGTIQVRDNVPRGTVFSFTLPAADLPAEA